MSSSLTLSRNGKSGTVDESKEREGDVREHLHLPRGKDEEGGEEDSS